MNNKRLLPALLTSLFASTAGAQAVPFSGVYSFGDSLSDAGYYRPFLVSLGLPPAVVAALGRFTTNPGLSFPEYLAQNYGFTLAPSNAGGTAYAQGGARVATNSTSTPPGSAQRPVSTQITEYLASSGGAADPNALYTVWAGANDLFQNLGAFSAGAITQAQLQANVLGAATAEVGQIGRLAQAGARYIMVVSLPNIGVTPQFAGSPVAASVTALSAGYNTTLFTGLASVGIRVIPVDTFTLLNEVVANPSLYGFTNATGMACGPFPPITTTPSSQFCLPTNLVAPNAAETYVFADSVHPTTATSRIVAQFAQSLIEGPVAYSALAEVPLRSRESHVRSITDGLFAGHEAPSGRHVFVAAEGSDFDLDAAPGSVGLDSRSRSFAVGATLRATPAFTIGAAIGKTRNEGRFGGSLGDWETDETHFSLLGGVRLERFYATGVFTISSLDFDHLSRNIVLGPATRVASASPGGSNASAFVTLGYDFPLGAITLGPTVTAAWQNVEIDSFEETGAMSANLRIGAQKRRSEVLSAGVRATMRFGDWSPWVRVTADKERRDDERFVSATPLSLGVGNTYDLPAFRGDDRFTTASVGVTGRIGDRVGVALAYTKVSGRSGVKQDGVGGMVSVKF